MSEDKKIIRTMTGTVVSNKNDKTITVGIERRVKHPIYGKYIRKSSKVHAHDDQNKCNIGDLVRVQECKPVSKGKTWELVEVIEQARG